MYELSDTTAAIREIQRFLFFISLYNQNDIRRISIDGIYGEETKGAVSDFQKLYGLQESGLVDSQTFNLMFLEYSDIRDSQRRSEYIITEYGFPITVGTQNNDVLHLHLIYEELRNYHKDIGYTKNDNYFSENSKKTTENLQRIFDLEDNGIVDPIFYERLLTELEAIRLIEGVFN